MQNWRGRFMHLTPTCSHIPQNPLPCGGPALAAFYPHIFNPTRSLSMQVLRLDPLSANLPTSNTYNPVQFSPIHPGYRFSP